MAEREFTPLEEIQEIKINEREGIEGKSHYKYKEYLGKNGIFTEAECTEGQCKGRKREYFNNLNIKLPVKLDEETVKAYLEMKEFGVVTAQGDNKNKAGKGHIWQSEKGNKWESEELTQKIEQIIKEGKLDWKEVHDIKSKEERGGNKEVKHQIADLPNNLKIHLFSIIEGAGKGRKWTLLEVPHVIKITEGQKKKINLGLGLVIEQGDTSDKLRSPKGSTHVENLGIKDYKE